MSAPVEYVEIDGHQVPAALAEWFYNANDGSRLTDEEWDVTRDRLREFGAWPFDEAK